MLHYHSIGSKKFPVFAAIEMMNNKMELSSSGLATSLWNRLAYESNNFKKETTKVEQWKVGFQSKLSCECPNNPKLATNIEIDPLQIYSSERNGLKTILVTNLNENNNTIDLLNYGIKNARVENYFAELKDEKWTSETQNKKGKINIPGYSIVYIKEIK
jgi:hypothetical protein